MPWSLSVATRFYRPATRCWSQWMNDGTRTSRTSSGPRRTPRVTRCELPRWLHPSCDDDAISEESGDQAQKQPIGQQVWAFGPGRDADQLGDDIQDRSRGQGQKDDTHGFAGELVAHECSHEGGPAPDGAHCQQEPPVRTERLALGVEVAGQRGNDAEALSLIHI